MSALAPGLVLVNRSLLVAVVANDPDFLDHVRRLLTDSGYQSLLWCYDAHLVDRLRRTPVGLLILDTPPARTPEDWPELLTIRQHVATRSLPIIVCSTESQRLQMIIDRLGETRCAVIQKPLVAADLLQRLRELRMMCLS